jgi:hypothetical protein
VGPEVWTQEQERRMEKAVSEERSQTIEEAVAWCAKAGSGGFVQEVVRLVSALGLSEESAMADGGENRGAGAGGL